MVRLLREAGAVILGKTAVPEMMLWPFTETVSYGATHNRGDLAHARRQRRRQRAAAGLGLAPWALGSDGAGSIRIPSTWCGLFGLKPQRDRCRWLRTTMRGTGLGERAVGAHRGGRRAVPGRDVTSPCPVEDVSSSCPRLPNRLRIALTRKVPPC